MSSLFRSDTFARVALCTTLSLAALGSAAAQTTDPRVGLHGGFQDAGQAISNLRLVSHTDKPASFYNPANLGDFGFLNSDIAIHGNTLYQGSFHGFQIWDLSNPAKPALKLVFACPGGQGDMTIYNNLLFMSVEETRGRIDCGVEGTPDSVSATRFRGVRIFDVSDMEHPRQVAAVQTCRGSHTNTLVEDPKDKRNIYIYVGGTAGVRSPTELAGCSQKGPDDPNSSLFRIDVIKVPLARPQDARVIASPRIFADSGRMNGLYAGGNHGQGTQTTAQTNQCHDITVYEAIGLAAGACSGNGILLDIRDPAHPRRVSEVSDPNFAYWHSATFNNDGSKVLFSDEWGGGTQARCQVTDSPQWGADAIFTIANRRMSPAGYYKVPAPQTSAENCVAHNGSLIPIPGRDVMVQAWYQGGLSVFDFTDGAHAKEIAYFDRGPIAEKLTLAGFWGAYWYNGMIIGSEIGRGLDIFTLAPSAELSQNEIDAANSVRVHMLNPQNQQRIVWPATPALAKSYLDQLERNGGLSADRLSAVRTSLDASAEMPSSRRRSVLRSLANSLERDARASSDARRVRWAADAVRRLAAR